MLDSITVVCRIYGVGPVLKAEVVGIRRALRALAKGREITNLERGQRI